MEIFLIIVFYILVFGIVAFCEFSVEHAWFYEPLEKIHRRRKAYLLKLRASKEYKLWLFEGKKDFKSDKHESDINDKICKLRLLILKIDNEIFEISNYLNMDRKD